MGSSLISFSFMSELNYFFLFSRFSHVLSFSLHTFINPHSFVKQLHQSVQKEGKEEEEGVEGERESD